MPPILTQVARSSDALPLVACSTPTHSLTVTNRHQQDAKQLMRSMTAGTTKMSIVSGNMVFYYMARENLCFLTLCEESYPKRTAFLYLEEVADVILQELLREFGNDWRIQVDQAARPFQFIHYDPIIQRKQREYRENRPQNKSQLNEDLSEIQTIMRKNIDEILNRGEKLDHVSNISQELRSKSKDFKWGTKKLTWQARLQQYGPMAVGVLIVLIVLYVKIFHIGF